MENEESVTRITRATLNRRTLLAGVGIGGAGMLSGCLSSDDANDDDTGDDDSDDPTTENGDDNGDSENGDDGDSDSPDTLSELTHDAFDVDEADHPLFYANPDVSGPGGDVSYIMTLEARGGGAGRTELIDQFETFIIRFNSGVLHREDGDDVTVPVEVTVDFTESVEERERFILTWESAIPTGKYTGLTYDVEAIELVHEEDGDVTEQFIAPEASEVERPAEVGEEYTYWSESEVSVDHEVHDVDEYSETTFSETNTLGEFIIRPN